MAKTGRGRRSRIDKVQRSTKGRSAMNERSRSFAAISIATNKDIKAAVESSDLNALLRSKLRKLTVDNQTYYLAEGDTLLDEDQLGVYALTKQKEAEAHKADRDDSGREDRALGT